MQDEDFAAESDATPGIPRRRLGGFHIFPIILFILFAVYYVTSNSQTVPITGRKHVVGISVQDEVALGLQSYADVLQQSEVIPNGRDADLVHSVGSRLAKATENSDFEWEFNLLRSPEVNAFCLPGGKVAVYSAILPVAESPDGLAVVLGHEIGHAIARHGAERIAHEQLAQLGQLAVGMAASDMNDNTRREVLGAFGVGAQFGVLLPFSRKNESEADHIGLILMARACFDPREAPKFWERMEQATSSGGRTAEFLSTHPNPERRIAQLEQWMPEALAEREKYCKQ